MSKLGIVPFVKNDGGTRPGAAARPGARSVRDSPIILG